MYNICCASTVYESRKTVLCRYFPTFHTFRKVLGVVRSYIFLLAKGHLGEGHCSQSVCLRSYMNKSAVLEDSLRTNFFGLGLGLGLECLASKVVFHGLDIKLHNLCAVTDKFFACFFPFYVLLASYRQIYLRIYDTVSCSNVSSPCLLRQFQL